MRILKLKKYNFYVFFSTILALLFANPVLFHLNQPVPEFIDPVFVKTSPKRSFSVIQNERFGLVFVKTGSIISGTGYETRLKMITKAQVVDFHDLNS